jgi:hypothetical protein
MGFVAESVGVGLNTARTHLKAVCAKTGVNHQTARAHNRRPLPTGSRAERARRPRTTQLIGRLDSDPGPARRRVPAPLDPR